MGTAPYTVFVNSCDAYEDCWAPYFRLLSLHWPDCSAPIVLNTEKKVRSFGEMSVTCTAVASGSSLAQSATWSECLLAGLKGVHTPLVLYMQEDYFLMSSVNSAAIDAMAAEMLKDETIKHIGLTHFGAKGPFLPSSNPLLWTVPAQAGYRISTQAGLWHVPTLRSYLRADENAWMFEIFGTERSRARKEAFLTVNRDYFCEGNRIVDYLHTGVIKGRWHPGVETLFAHSGISIDLSRRGFYREPPAWIRKAETVSRLLAKPSLLMRLLLSKAWRRNTG
jgi:hypothetical protein